MNPAYHFRRARLNSASVFPSIKCGNGSTCCRAVVKMRCVFKQAVPSVREMPYDKVELLRLPPVGRSPLVVCFWCQVKVKSLSHIRLFATPWTVAYQSPLSMEFSRQEYWSRLPFPSPGDLPDPGIEPGSPALQADALPSEPPGKQHTSLPALFLMVSFSLSTYYL